MATFHMFGRYSADAVRNMSLERTQQAVREVEKLGGSITAMHALLGEYDLLFCVQLPTVDDAMKASINLTKLTGISFTTCPSISVEAFDRLVSQ